MPSRTTNDCGRNKDMLLLLAALAAPAYADCHRAVQTYFVDSDFQPPDPDDLVLADFAILDTSRCDVFAHEMGFRLILANADAYVPADIYSVVWLYADDGSLAAGPVFIGGYGASVLFDSDEIAIDGRTAPVFHLVATRNSVAWELPPEAVVSATWLWRSFDAEYEDGNPVLRYPRVNITADGVSLFE